MSTNNPQQGSVDKAGSVGQAGGEQRAKRKVARGTVVSDRMQKTIIVQVDRKVRHPLYEKFVARRTKLVAHDEKSEAKMGDVVEIVQTRPLSKTKCWRLDRIVQKA